MEGNAGGNAAGRGVDGSMLREKVDGAEKGEAGGGIAGVTGKGVEGKRVPGAFSASTTAIVVLACRRLHYLKETIKGVLALEGIDGYRVYLSQDGADGAVMAYARGLAQDYPFVRYLNNDMRRDHSQVRDGRVSAMLSIADHYKFVLTSVFEREEGVAHAILLEEDMVVSPDILDYFQQTAPLLDSDPSLFCVSSWNDNGYRQLDLDEKRLMRTAYFPGLGWMLRKQLWTEELSAKWPHNPTTGWDHWMRVDAQARGRECIVPEVSRNRNIGEQGATVSKEDFDRKLGAIRYSTAAHTDFGDLSFLHPDAYRAHLRQLLAAAEPLSASMGLGAAGVTGKVYRVGYLREDWAALAKRVGAYVSSSPRLHSDHVTLLRRDGNTYLFYDKRLRFSPTLTPHPSPLTPHPLLPTPPFA
jgi:alpha-1,3-mannosyl-glycoprotein beta-1,2-N-acetylglucosaminyltransferase